MKKYIGGLFLLFLSLAVSAANIGLTGLKDVRLGANLDPSTNNIEQTQKLCVYSKTGQYLITFETANSSDKYFYIKTDQQKIPVYIYWNGVELKPNVASRFATSQKSETLNNCQNVEFKYQVADQANAKLAGLYIENLRYKLNSV